MDVVSNDDRELLVEALAALLRERYSAFRIATQVAGARGRDQPDVKDFGLADILRLHRQLEVRSRSAQGNLAATARPDNEAIDFAMLVR
ncbi:MAG: hypothetical protein JO371_13290 [Paraburkholderia sp.]|nr:hypothetical protein [Paraburkholderia sp.]